MNVDIGGVCLRRIDRVFKKLKELSGRQGITTIEIANSLGLSRANVSSDLNKLCEEGKVIKKNGKPVLFMISNNPIKVKNTLDTFAEKNESLYVAIEQAKAAILYPPNGMNMLILGETGVGKSMFVGLIYNYAIEMKRFKQGAPFVIFNCADYASNPQLLLSQLFGCKKGAYTGADSDKVGLIDKANKGILFLDEVHRLPPEGQEMLFSFIDNGIYRRLGETEVERKADVLIISATTEDPETSLLKTFTRRIPMIINIPSLKNRTLEERFQLISTFIKEECSRLNEEIKVSVNSMKALLSYECSNNIGELKSTIQLICAKVYSEFLAGKKNSIKINTLDLPPHIKKGLYNEIEHRQLWNKLIDINKKYCIFNNKKGDILFEDYKDKSNIYEVINLRYHELKTKDIDEESLQEAMKGEIKSYFRSYFNKFNNKFDISKLASLIDEEIMKVIDELIKFSEGSLDRKLSKKVCYGMSVHINSSIERIRSNKKIINPHLNKIRIENPEEFNIALDCLKIIERAIDIRMPIDEAGFLAIFLAYDNKKEDVVNKEVKIIVLAHGGETATSMAEAANKLLGTKYAVGINAPINEKPENVLERVKIYIRENEIKSDILLLVDMGSLTTFGREIEKEFNINVKIFPLVSTLHVIEATRKAMMGCNLVEILNETIKVNELYKDDILEMTEDITNEYESRNKLCILCMCTTGEGSAQSIKTLLDDNIKYDKSLIEILTLNLIGNDGVKKRIKSLKKDYDILSIVSTFHVKEDIPQFNLEDIFIGDGISKIQKIIDLETTYIKMSETLKTHLKNIDGFKVLRDVKLFNNKVQKIMKNKIETNRLIGITLHIACMLDRVQNDVQAEEFVNKESFIESNKELYKVIKMEIETLGNKYKTDIDINEICYIMSFFNGAMKTN